MLPADVLKSAAIDADAPPALIIAPESPQQSLGQFCIFI